MAKKHATVSGKADQLDLMCIKSQRAYAPAFERVVDCDFILRPDLKSLYFDLRNFVIGASNHIVVAAARAIIKGFRFGHLWSGSLSDWKLKQDFDAVVLLNRKLRRPGNGNGNARKDFVGVRS